MFKSLPASFTTPGTNYIIRPAYSTPTEGRTEKFRSILYASRITPFPILFMRSHSRGFHSSIFSVFPSQTFRSVLFHSCHDASPDSVNKGLVVGDTNILLRDTLSGVVCHCSRMLASEPNGIVWAFHLTAGYLLCSGLRLIPRPLQSCWASEH